MATGLICGSTPPYVKVRQNGRIVSVELIVAVGGRKVADQLRPELLKLARFLDEAKKMCWPT